jgi:hypothetical protein
MKISIVVVASLATLVAAAPTPVRLLFSIDGTSRNSYLTPNQDQGRGSETDVVFTFAESDSKGPSPESVKWKRGEVGHTMSTKMTYELIALSYIGRTSSGDRHRVYVR